MKKSLTFLILVFIITNTKAQFVTIPDDNFRAYLMQNFPSCFNGAQMMDTTCTALSTGTVMSLSAAPTDTLPVISSLEGLQYFKSLRTLVCDGQPITSLPHLPDSLDQLEIVSSQITQLPDLPKMLRFLDVPHNLLTSLPDSIPVTMNRINCSFNNLTSLPDLGQHPGQWLITLYSDHNNIYCFPFRSEVPIVSIDTSKIRCLPNDPYVHDEFSNLLPLHSFPVCSPLTNKNSCFINPVIIGKVFYDINSNGVRDANEIYKRNVRVQLTGGTIGYSDNDGAFKVYAYGTGDYTLTVNPPLYYSAIAPMTLSVNANDTIFVGDLPLQPTISLGAVSVSVTPFTAARPGYNFGYWINYENTGTTTLSPGFVLNYDNTKLTYDQSTIGSVTDNGSSLSIAASSFIPGEDKTFFAQFVVKPTADLGSIIIAHAIVTAGTKTASDSAASVITGSYDPNDKDATPYLSTDEVNGGTYINYLIRFQNTGTDTAFNVIITDTLNSSLLQSNTLKMIDASHPCKVTQKGANTLFEFTNILLPDSNVNEAKSHGFVRFKVRAKTTLPANTTINNIAGIYFDFNSPVATNIASTVVNFTVVPLNLLSFKAYTQAGNIDLLKWTTANEINTRSFDVEESIDGRIFKTIANVPATGSGDNSYLQKVILPAAIVYYKLKMIDIDGKFTFSDVVVVRSTKDKAAFSILSNPVKGEMQMDVIDESLIGSQANIISNTGAIVKTFILIYGINSVDVSALSTGTYFIKTRSGSKKILIAR
ncbi:MAG: hypothetical protein ABI402_15290 [Ferruginibacter sp.]